MQEVGNIEQLQEDENIVYYSNGHIKDGKINNLYRDPETGEKYFSTKVKGNYYPDTGKISEDIIIGRKLIEVKNIGWLVRIIQSRIFSIISIIILWWIYYFNKFKYKEERKRKIKKKYKEVD